MIAVAFTGIIIYKFWYTRKKLQTATSQRQAEEDHQQPLQSPLRLSLRGGEELRQHNRGFRNG